MNPATPIDDAADPLARCLDPQALQRLLHPLHAGAAIDHVEVSQVRRSSSRRRHPHPLTMCIALDLRGPEGTARTQRYYARVYRDGASARETEPGTLHLPALDMRLWPWPADPGLPQLPALLRPDQTLPFWGEPAAQVRLLRHTPECRATLLYTRAGASVACDPARQLVAKTFADERGAAIHARFEYFHALTTVDEHAPRVAEPLAYDAVTRTLWQPHAPGRPLTQLSPQARGAFASRVARAWATLHTAPVALAGEERHDLAHWLAEIRRRERKIARSLPELAGRAARLADTLQAAAQGLPAAPPTLIHGDCHADQLWVAGEQVVMFDFDEFALGDPMEDLAAFVTRLGGLPDGARFATDLLAAYAQAAPQHFSQRRLRWHMAVQLLLQAARAFRFQVPDWRDALARHLAGAEAMAAPQFEETHP